MDWNNTILHAACSVPKGHNIISELLKLNVKTDFKNKELELPIHIAIKYDHTECIETLINHKKFLLFVIDKNGFGLIHKASEHLALKSIELIIKHQINVDSFI